jgi:soluble lytic murein transglycosylase-like protein
MKFACLTLAFAAFCGVISKETHILSKSPGTSSPALPEAPVVAVQKAPPQLLVNKLPQNQIDPMIRKAAQKHRVKAALVKGIVAAESAFNANAKSAKGALGLMQLMPGTAQEYGADPMDPAQNIDAGTQYLKVLLTRYGRYRNCMVRVIAAYNAGPANVDRYRGVPPFRETRGYVQRVMAFMRQFEHDPS